MLGGISSSRSRGIYLWRTPHGSIFLVDHTGTRQLRRPSAGGRTPSGPTLGQARTAGMTGPTAVPLEERFQAILDAA